MTKVLHVTKGANVNHVLQVYEDTHTSLFVESDSIDISRIHYKYIIVIEQTAIRCGYYLLIPKEGTNGTS